MLATDRSIHGVAVAIPCRDLDEMVDFFRDQLGFRIEVISPADSPRTALMSGHGSLVRLRRVHESFDPGVLELLCEDGAAGQDIVAPNGTQVRVLPMQPDVDLPALEQSLVISRLSNDFGTGRASMQYRDLVPDRQGGRFIASHIRIPSGGPVPDYVHFHKVRFQMIFVYRGWVKVVYEDQGEPFVMQAGDCVLQPPTIRHRVLESSDGLDVIEIGCPAEHDTVAEHTITLPTGRTIPDRDFGGQLFSRHVAASGPWVPFRFAGFSQQDCGIGSATHGLAGARVYRPEGANSTPMAVIDNEFLFTFILDGSADLVLEGLETQRLGAGDSFIIPSNQRFGLSGISADARFLEVSLPADLRPRV